MGDAGSPHGRLQRALANRNLTAAYASALELPEVALEDALALSLLMRDKEPARYERAGVRFLARYLGEVERVGLDEATIVTAALAALRGEEGRLAARSLAELWTARGETRLGEVLRRWVEQPD